MNCPDCDIPLHDDTCRHCGHHPPTWRDQITAARQAITRARNRKDTPARKRTANTDR